MLYKEKKFTCHNLPEKLDITYLEWANNSKETVICLHGLTRNAYDFVSLGNYLSKNFHVISINIVGRGTSQRFIDPSYYNYDNYLKMIDEFLHNFSQVNYIGTSLGGIIGMMLANHRPNLIKKLVLNDIGIRIPKDPLIRIAKYVGLNIEFPSLEAAKNQLKIILSPFGIKSEKDWDFLLKHSFIKNENNKYKLNYDPNIAIEFKKRVESANFKEVKFDHLWGNFKCEDLLVVRGKNSDILTQEYIDIMKKIRPFKLLEIENVGHAPSLMEDTQIEAISQFIQS